MLLLLKMGVFQPKADHVLKKLLSRTILLHWVRGNGGGGACTENNVQTNSCGKNIQLRSFTRWGVRGSFWENGKHNSITR